ncbi:MAG: hypothetical protein MZV70_60095 [Desulfobacterales bacterium]|nr:hypothetical protein [Desulfobacterales bacterium]
MPRPTFQEVRETIYETPLTVEGRQIGHCRILCTKTPDFDRELWIKKVDFYNAGCSPPLSRPIQS